MTAALTPAFWRAGAYRIDLSRPVVMGIVNITPDSFSDGGVALDPAAAIARARMLIDEGADIIDLGAESSRPGAQPLTPREELQRLIPVLKGLAGIGVPLSVDSYHPQTMRIALQEGAAIVNDISALRGEGAQEIVAASDCGVCLMHMQGTPTSMQIDPSYVDVVGEVATFLQGRAQALEALGVAHDRIVIDPGFGFGKTHDHNLALMRGLSRVAEMGYPTLVGLSRKRMIAQWSGRPDSLPSQRVSASVTAALYAISQGARIVRVHDVGPTVEAIALLRVIDGR